MLRRGMTLARPLKTRGFTLLELMVTLAVIGIVALVAIPGMRALVNHSRLTGGADNVVSAMQLARIEATRRNRSVWVCPTASASSDTCSSGTTWTNWIVVEPTNANTADRVIRRDVTESGGLQFSGPSAGIRFRPSGLIDAAASVTVCMATTQPAENRRVVTVNMSGSVTTTRVNGGGACP